MHAIHNDRLAADDKSFGGQKRHTRQRPSCCHMSRAGKKHNRPLPTAAQPIATHMSDGKIAAGAFCPALARKDMVEKLRQEKHQIKATYKKSLIGPLLGNCTGRKRHHRHTTLENEPVRKDTVDTVSCFTYGRGVVLRNCQSWNRPSDRCWIANTFGGQKKLTMMQRCWNMNRSEKTQSPAST